MGYGARELTRIKLGACLECGEGPIGKYRRCLQCRNRITAAEYRKLARKHETEAQIQKAICQYLAAQRIPHSVTDATESFNRNGQRVRRVRRGWPDVVGCIPTRIAGNNGGAFLAIECKSAKGRLRPDQARTLHELYQAGALVCVARSVDDVIEMLERGCIRDCDVAEICKYKDKA